MVCPASHKTCVSRGTQGHQLESHPCRVRDCHPLQSTVPGRSTRDEIGNSIVDLQLHMLGLTTLLSYRLAGHSTITVWAFPRSLATTRRIVSFPRGTKMFQFPRSPPPDLCVQSGVRRVFLRGFPHSGISGSTPAHGLPRAYRSVPRPSSASSAKASTVCP